MCAVLCQSSLFGAARMKTFHIWNLGMMIALFFSGILRLGSNFILLSDLMNRVEIFKGCSRSDLQTKAKAFQLHAVGAQISK